MVSMYFRSGIRVYRLQEAEIQASLALRLFERVVHEGFSKPEDMKYTTSVQRKRSNTLLWLSAT